MQEKQHLVTRYPLGVTTYPLSAVKSHTQAQMLCRVQPTVDFPLEAMLTFYMIIRKRDHKKFLNFSSSEQTIKK